MSGLEHTGEHFTSHHSRGSDSSSASHSGPLSPKPRLTSRYPTASLRISKIPRGIEISEPFGLLYNPIALSLLLSFLPSSSSRAKYPDTSQATTPSIHQRLFGRANPKGISRGENGNRVKVTLGPSHLELGKIVRHAAPAIRPSLPVTSPDTLVKLVHLAGQTGLARTTI